MYRLSRSLLLSVLSKAVRCGLVGALAVSPGDWADPCHLGWSRDCPPVHGEQEQGPRRKKHSHLQAKETRRRAEPSSEGLELKKETGRSGAGSGWGCHQFGAGGPPGTERSGQWRDWLSAGENAGSDLTDLEDVVMKFLSFGKTVISITALFLEQISQGQGQNYRLSLEVTTRGDGAISEELRLL